MPRRRVRRALLALIVLVGAAPRLFDLGGVPPALHHDEAATGADALEVWERPALTFAHEGGGWVEGTYVWIAAPGVRLARTSGWPSLEAAVRAPAAVAGVLLIPLVYLLGAALGGEAVGLAAALCLACSPWGWHFSRLGLRATLVPALTVGGLVAALRARGGPRPAAWALAAGGLWALAAATYPPARLTVPLLAALTVATVGPRGRAGAAAVAPPWAVLVGLLPWTLAGPGAERLDAVRVDTLGAALKGYVVHYLPRFLFSGSTSRGFAPEGVGLLPVWVGLAVAVGLAVVARDLRRAPRRGPSALALGWLLVFPLAAAPTRDVPNALRAAVGLPLFALLGGVGVVAVLRRAGARRAVAVGALALAIGVSTAHGAHAYFVRYPRAEARFYRPERRALVEAARAAVAAGETVVCAEPFWEASLRLYAPELPRRRLASAWAVGAGAPTVELTVADGAVVRRPWSAQAAGSPDR